MNVQRMRQHPKEHFIVVYLYSDNAGAHRIATFAKNKFAKTKCKMEWQINRMKMHQ